MPSKIENATVQKAEDLIQSDVALTAFNTFAFSYQAEYFAIAETLNVLTSLLKWANHHNVHVTIIGGGSNLLISDDLPGLVIINRLAGISAQHDNEDSVLLTVASGENWHQVVQHTVEQGWYGIENLALIPGTAGAAPVQNIGAYGVEVKDVLTRVQVISRQTCEVSWINASDCGFGYRDSNFKQKWKDSLIITSIELKLQPRSDLLLSYGGLSTRIEGEPSLQKVFDTVCEVRQEKLPTPSVLSNAGSFFKNPIVSHEQHHALKLRYPNLVSFPFLNGFKLAAGWLIDQAGWKGKTFQGVGVYEKQALVLVNFSADKAEPLLALESDIKRSVLERYGVDLEREPVELPQQKTVETETESETEIMSSLASEQSH